MGHPCLLWANPLLGFPSFGPPFILLTLELSNLLVKIKTSHCTAPQTCCLATYFCALFVLPFLLPSAIKLNNVEQNSPSTLLKPAALSETPSSYLIAVLQFSSVTQPYPTLCDSMDCSTPVRLRVSLIAQLVKNPPAMQETLVQLLHWEDCLKKG